MFTGIVESTGTITDSRNVAGGRRLRLEVGDIAPQCKLGDSVSVSGVCLTVAAVAGPCLEFDVISETLSRSTLGNKKARDPVNIERSLRLGDRLHGHFVQGHVDGTAVVERVQRTAREHVVWFRPAATLTPFLVPKGSVAVDGVSLTIAAVSGSSFSVALIPTTLTGTTLGSLAPGDEVNVETDIITRTVVHRLSEMSAAGGLTLETLQKAGFA